jgi:predicted NAD-dependent protein-ADP-ribosyltransferase YbiA (DUF1768 family)
MFDLENLPRIRLTSAVREAVLKETPLMSDHHTGMPVLGEPVITNGLTIRTFKEEDPKMFAVVTRNPDDVVLLVFTRCGLTNFAFSPVDLHGVPFSCSEQLFKAFCVSVHYDSADDTSNLDDVMKAILFAAKPKNAKTATNAIKNFKAHLWNSKSCKAMLASILLILTNKITFDRLKAITALAGEGKRIEVIEANDNDAIWGINMFGGAFLELLAAKYETDAPDLLSAARGLYKGDNRLGTILTSVLQTIGSMEHTDFLDAVKGVMFAEIVA